MFCLLSRIMRWVLGPTLPARLLVDRLAPRWGFIKNISSSRQIDIAPYLLDRTIPAEEVLKKLTPADSARLEFVVSEHRLMFDGGQKVAPRLTSEMMLDLLCCKSYSARVRLHEFFFKRQIRRENRVAKKAHKVSRRHNEPNVFCAVLCCYCSKALLLKSKSHI